MNLIRKIFDRNQNKEPVLDKILPRVEGEVKEKLDNGVASGIRIDEIVDAMNAELKNDKDKNKEE